MSSASDPEFPEPGLICFTRYERTDERRRESLFGLGNGVLFVRASLPEAAVEQPGHYPGTYCAGLYDRRMVNVGGQAFGFEGLANLPNWLALTFRVEGEEGWFSTDGTELLEYRHALDFHCGIAERAMLVRDRSGRKTRLRERRLVSMSRPDLAAFRLELTPVNWSGRIEFRSSIERRIANHNTDASALSPYPHIEFVRADQAGPESLLLAGVTRHSRRAVSVAVRTRGSRLVHRRKPDGQGGLAERLLYGVECGGTLAIEKVAAIAVSDDEATADLTRIAAEAAAQAPPFGRLEMEQRSRWAALRDRIAIEADDARLRRGLEFHAFELLQTVSPHSAEADVALPSRGWQEAYHGQIFWDQIFAFPFLSHRFPEIARGLLAYRFRRLPEARRAARAAGYSGAMFPWRSAATGSEETPALQFNPLSGRWLPDHTRLQHHIGAAIVHNIWEYYLASGDERFLAEQGAELIVEIARFWASIAVLDPADGRYHIFGTIGPDEYHNAYPGAVHPGLNDNAYTNVMAAVTLRRACDVLDHLAPDRREALCRSLVLGAAEPDRWKAIAKRLRVPILPDGVIGQFEGFDRLRPFDREAFARQHPGRRTDRQLEALGDSADAYQVCKQADTLMLFYLFSPDALLAQLASMDYRMDVAALRRTVDYYLARLTHESSLSRVVCAGALAELDPRASWSFFERALFIDFDPQNSAGAEEGLHLGTMAGTLDVLQRHYFGVRPRLDGLELKPNLPCSLGPVRMRLPVRQSRLTLDWNGDRLRVFTDVPLLIVAEDRTELLHPGQELLLPGRR
jgi:trehalose/maltose hydrolase-like predicted phosphorylase